jgi:hypothetical protein
VIYGVPMPFSHQYSLGMEKPSVPYQYNLSFADSWSECVPNFFTIEREVPDTSPVHVPDMKDLAMRNIMEFSRSRGKIT